MYDVEKARKAQKKYVEQTGSPFFAPESGRCWRCHNNIYEPKVMNEGQENEYIKGITVEEAGTRLITGCPHCNMTYCD